MTASARPPLTLLADLSVTVDGVEAKVSGSGQRLSISTRHPYRLARHALRGPGQFTRSRAAQLATMLSAQGVTVDVVGPRGRITTVGAGAESTASRLLTGSRNVSIIAPRRSAAFAAGLVGAVLAVLALRGRLRNRPNDLS